ncbi:PAS domain-containing protein [Methylomonas fluvii]|uniref:PAS domain-containing protein n=1 Tax=Methylomonas fluvii TaxID=1854564 RepID=A0ABR9DH27_9GAMM|nr:PAS domain-containing protein [Methylomonas fluvii]MBD9362401.1 PAS domain-containing protein [Methylomonas fluvii]
MDQKWDGIERRKSLRKTAEAMVANLSPEQLRAKPVEMLLHELLVHKIELEMQFDELQRIDVALTTARDRYRALYDFAPIGYLVIDSAEQIDEINLTGAALLGIPQGSSLKPHFSKFVAAAHRERWSGQFRNMMDLVASEQLALELEMTRSDGSQFIAHLNCRHRELVGAQVLLISITEIGKS